MRSNSTTMEGYLRQHEARFLTQVLIAVGPCRLLDICCGSGRVTWPLYETHWPVAGLDIERTALDRFRQHAKRAALIQGDALRLPVSSGSVGCVVAIHGFDHLDRIQFLGECHRVLYSGGVLVFDALNRDSYKLAQKRLRRFLGGRFRGSLSNKWIDVLSCQDVQALIADAGFDLASASGYGWIPFSVASNSRLVRVAAAVEEALPLDRLTSISPRVLLAVRKSAKL